jgi:hypothetical protein
VSELSMEESAAYVAERGLAQAAATEQVLRIRVAKLEARLRLFEEMADRLYEQITTEPDRTRAAVVKVLRDRGYDFDADDIENGADW